MDHNSIDIFPGDSPESKRNLDILVVRPMLTDSQQMTPADKDAETFDGSLIVLEDGRAVEFLANWQPDRIRRHDLLLGIVTRPMPQLEGAFVAVGTGHDGLLRLEKGAGPLKVGSRVMVRVLREQTPGKGPVLSMNLSIPSRYAVFRSGQKPLRRSLTKTLTPSEADRLFQDDLEQLTKLYQRQIGRASCRERV